MAIQFTVSAKAALGKHLQSLKGAGVTVNGVRYEVVGVDDDGLRLATPAGVPAEISWSAIEALVISSSDGANK